MKSILTTIMPGLPCPLQWPISLQSELTETMERLSRLRQAFNSNAEEVFCLHFILMAVTTTTLILECMNSSLGQHCKITLFKKNVDFLVEFDQPNGLV